MLNEVRKAAFGLRKYKSKEPCENNDEEDDKTVEQKNTTLPLISEEWESWYPQEWLGWCRYGVPSDDPTEFWVKATISNGPTEMEQPFTNDQVEEICLKPTGRAMQRDSAVSSLSDSEILLNKNTLLAHFVDQFEEEVRIKSREFDLKLIALLHDRASSEEERSRINMLLDRYLRLESAALTSRLFARQDKRY